MINTAVLWEVFEAKLLGLGCWNALAGVAALYRVRSHMVKARLERQNGRVQTGRCLSVLKNTCFGALISTLSPRRKR